jgi:Glycosyltransferase family 87
MQLGYAVGQQKYMATILLWVSAVYVFLGGVLALWYPDAWEKMDFNVFYEAGSLAWNGINPYTSTTSGLFVYPPAWIALCALLSSLPWWAAVALWKLLNLCFLGGAVWLSARLFLFSLVDYKKELVFCFACLLWPTLTTLREGQTSLFVLFFMLYAILLWREDKRIAAGVTLGLSLMKPHLAAPLLLLLAWRRQGTIIFWALAFVLSLSYVGLWLANTSITSFLDAIDVYAGGGISNVSSDPPNIGSQSSSDPYNVGIQNLSAILLHLSSARARQLAAVSGVLFLLSLYISDRGNRGCRDTTNLLPLILLSGPLFFGARSYDLVLVIPFFAWCLARIPASSLGWVGAVSCLALFVPLQVVERVYRACLVGVVPSAIFAVVLRPFRSWVLLALLASGLTLYLTGQRRPLLPEAGRLGPHRG